MNKKIIQVLMVVVVAILTSSSVYAQKKGETAFGGGLSVGTGDDYTNVGIGAKFQWNPIDNLRLEPSVNYFFKKDYNSIWDASANLHYLIPVSDKITLYPLAGLGMMNIKFHGNSIDDIQIGDMIFQFKNTSETYFAFNLGAGADFAITDNWVLNIEFKYKISEFNRAVFSMGVAYKF